MYIYICMYKYICVGELKREREREGDKHVDLHVHSWDCIQRFHVMLRKKLLLGGSWGLRTTYSRTYDPT